jgi:hypothetical protein
LLHGHTPGVRIVRNNRSDYDERATDAIAGYARRARAGKYLVPRTDSARERSGASNEERA